MAALGTSTVRWALLALCLAVLLGACALLLGSVTPKPAQAETLPGGNGKIVFVSDRCHGSDLTPTPDPTVCDSEIWIMDPDGGNQQPVTDDPCPTGSASGSDCFTALPNGQTDTATPEDGSPSWSPDGGQIVFQRSVHNPSSPSNLLPNDIYKINQDGSGLTQLTTDAAEDRHPTWAPDGTQIAFESDRDETLEDAVTGEVLFVIYVMGTDGSGQTRISDGIAEDRHPAWSPDGNRIVIRSKERPQPGGRPVGPPFKIWTMDAGGAGNYLGPLGDNGPEPITSRSFDELPVWAPDQQQAAFTSKRCPGFHDSDCTEDDKDVYRMSTDGSGVVRLTPDSSRDDEHPAWSPDDGLIAFASDRTDAAVTNDKEIYVMSAADGSGVTQLTTNTGNDDHSPNWQRIPQPAGAPGDDTAPERETAPVGDTAPQGDTAPEPQPRSRVRGFREEGRRFRVSLAGVPRRCMRRAFRARVRVRTNRRVRRVRVLLDGRQIRSTRKRRFSVRVRAGRLEPGRHRITVGARLRGGRLNRTTRRFIRCPRRAARPIALTGMFDQSR